MKKITIKPIPSNQTSINVLFTTAQKKEKVKPDIISPPPLKREYDELVKKFYESLTIQQKLAHEIAAEKLGTSYDVTRTHGYLNWMKTMK